MKRVLLAVLIFGGGATARADAAADELFAAQLVEATTLAKIKPEEKHAAVEKVAKIYEELVQKYPRDAAVREAYGAFFWQTERRDRAVEQWTEGLSLDPKNADISFHLGSAFLELGDVKRAVQKFANAAEFAPKNALYHFHLGNALYLFRHQLHDALAPDDDAVAQRAFVEFHRAAELEPFNEEFAKGYADAFYTLAAPDWDAARRAWQHYLEVSPHKDFAYTNLVRVSLKMGRKVEAAAFLQHVTSPDFGRARERLQRQIEATP